MTHTGTARELMSVQPPVEDFSDVAQLIVDCVVEQRENFAQMACASFDYSQSLFLDPMHAIESINVGCVHVVIRDDIVNIFASPLLAVGFSVIPAFARQLLVERLDEFPLYPFTRGVNAGAAYITVYSRDRLRDAIAERICTIMRERCVGVSCPEVGLSLCMAFLGTIRCRKLEFEGFDALEARFRPVFDLDGAEKIAVADSNVLFEMMKRRLAMDAGSPFLFMGAGGEILVSTSPESSAVL